MKRTSHTAALAASLVFGSVVAAVAADDSACVPTRSTSPARRWGRWPTLRRWPPLRRNRRRRPKEEPLPPPRRPALGGLSAFGGARDVFDSGRPDFHRRRAEPEPVPEVAAPPEPQKVEAPPPPKPRLFMHDGLDLVAVTGTEIYAAADGVVTGAGPNGRYGNWMQIDHAGKMTTVYGTSRHSLRASRRARG